MKLLLDQGLPRGATDVLKAAGLDAIHVGDIGHARAGDDKILAFAAAEGRAVATLDADFHRLLAMSGAAGPSVIRIREEGLGAEALARLLLSVLKVAASELSSGAAVAVQLGRVRIRRLPLG